VVGLADVGHQIAGLAQLFYIFSLLKEVSCLLKRRLHGFCCRRDRTFN